MSEEFKKKIFKRENESEVKGSVFTTSFKLNEVSQNDAVWSDDYMIQGLPFCVGVKHFPDKMSLGIFLAVKSVKLKPVKSCKVRFRLKLLNKISNKSVTQEFEFIFKPGGIGYGYHSFINWYRFKDSLKGFVDKKNKFSVQTTIKIINTENTLTPLQHKLKLK
ncbi:hypothetical protein SNE40_022259 [Patella caerulea]|uniref:MATH domain-containing protein n=1 Tax=Patella caerulea TaxID=87958 RepID=A0AAN8G3K7_PATCE